MELVYLTVLSAHTMQVINANSVLITAVHVKDLLIVKRVMVVIICLQALALHNVLPLPILQANSVLPADNPVLHVLVTLTLVKHVSVVISSAMVNVYKTAL